MRLVRLHLLLLIFGCSLAAGVRSAYAGVEQISEEEFRQLAAELSPKVNLFRDAWEKDPQAQFYGGTTRDYLYWLKGKFRGAQTRAAAERVLGELRARPAIDVREFIIGDSDVDLFSHQAAAIKPDAYGVKKIDVQKPDVLDPTTELGRGEVNQGFIPAEKIRLSRAGLASSPELGDGVHEIYSGKLTVHFANPEVFKTTKYAAEGINHPILLALRYLRLQAINYFQEHGGGVVDRASLRAQLDPSSAAEVKRVIAQAAETDVLKPYLAKPQFKKWINAGIQKAFRSYTNPNAAKALMEDFGVHQLPVVYSGAIDPVNQYVFAKHRDEAAVERAWAQAGMDPANVFRPAAEEFPDGFLYHGTRTEPAFRAILFQGVLGSENGSAGEGLYGVSVANKDFAERWAADRNRLLRLPVKPAAKIIDVTEGEGKQLWDRFIQTHGRDYERFADTYGADIVRYPYETRAYVVKNSEALGKAEGVYRQIMTFPELLERARRMKDAGEFLDLVSVNSFSEQEITLAVREAGFTPEAAERAFREDARKDLVVKYFFPELLGGREDLYREYLGYLERAEAGKPNKQANGLMELAQLLGKEKWRGREDLVLAYVTASPNGYLGSLILRDPNQPRMPKAYAAVTKKIQTFENELDVLLPIFQNPAYAGAEEEFAALVKAARTRPEVDSALRALNFPHWTKRPDLLAHALQRYRVHGSSWGEDPVLDLFQSAAWLKDQPDMMRTQLRLQLEEERTGQRDRAYVTKVLTRADTPFDDKSVGYLTERAMAADELIALVNDPRVARFREVIIAGIIDSPHLRKASSLIDLAEKAPLTPAQLRAARERFDSFFEVGKSSFHEAVVNLARMKPLGEPDADLIARFDRLASRSFASETFPFQHASFMRDGARGRREVKEFTAALPKILERWSGEIGRRPSVQKMFVFLMNRAPPVEFLPFLLPALADPALPADVSKFADNSIVAMASLIAKAQDGLHGDSRKVRPAEVLSRLLDARPALLEDHHVRDNLRRAVELNLHDPDFSFLALLLERKEKLPFRLHQFIQDSKLYLKEHGVPVDVGCDASFGALKGGAP